MWVVEYYAELDIYMHLLDTSSLMDELKILADLDTGIQNNCTKQTYMLQPATIHYLHSLAETLYLVSKELKTKYRVSSILYKTGLSLLTNGYQGFFCWE
jgi:hypothetical protein